MSGVNVQQELQRNPALQPLVQQLTQGMQQMPQPMGQMPQMPQPMPQMPQMGQQPQMPQMQQPMQQGYDPMAAIAQMQRPPAQVQNPIFGGAIPMNFALPEASRIPAGYESALAGFKPNPDTVESMAQKLSKDLNRRMSRVESKVKDSGDGSIGE